MIGYQFILQDHDVEQSLDRLMLLLSQDGLWGFLAYTMQPYLQKRAKERFRMEGDDVTGPWAPLKPSTVAIRENGPWQVGGDHPINRRTGELERWVTKGGQKSDIWPSDTGATLSFPSRRGKNADIRAKMQTAQLGRTHPSTVPRPVIGVNETDMIFFQTALTLAVEEAIRS
jgi:hypothetical protein